jgi:Holliday junction DNA helicase RuvB
MEFYKPEELETIFQKAAGKLKVNIHPTGLSEIAKRARGTPRIALRLLKRARDYAQVKGHGTIADEQVAHALDLLEVDPLGLDSLDRRYLAAIIEKYSGGPVGIETIAASISEDSGTLEEMVEPYLMQIGFIKRTKAGRTATEKAYKHLGQKFPAKGKQEPLL